ncbi:MAG: hypothetical protein M1835_007618 [Candelina submexicana]|nr:MAG: hypothetical protein M1835_007618 [Candelina submexicana]
MGGTYPAQSLWLVPPATHPIHNVLSNLITTQIPSVPGVTPLPPNFPPHITLTTGIPQNLADPQRWLDNIDLGNATQTKVRLLQLDTEDRYFKKVTLRVETAGVQGLASRLRMVKNHLLGKSTKDADEEGKTYSPHLSLM